MAMQAGTKYVIRHWIGDYLAKGDCWNNAVSHALRFDSREAAQAKADSIPQAVTIEGVRS